MNEAKSYKICSCGHIFRTELSMYHESIPEGLQKTGKGVAFDLELRTCRKCLTTFAFKITKVVTPPKM